MPFMETVLIGLNRTINDASTRQKCRETNMFAPGVRLSDLAGQLGLTHGAKTDGWRAYLEAMPEAVNASLAAILKFVTDRDDLTVNFAWDSGYDWEIRVKHSRDGRETRGGVHVFVTSPYPADHPR